MKFSIKEKKSLLIILILISAIRITFGEWRIPLSEVIRFLLCDDGSPASIIVRSVRVPRLLCSIGTGGLLSVAGVVFQGLLANPLAEPYTLGIASGAAFGASLGIVAGSFMVMPMSFAGALSALLLTGLIARAGPEKIILAGVISNSILSAGVTFVKSIAGDKIGAVVMWLMGSMSGAGSRDVAAVYVGVLSAMIPALAFAPALDAMSLGQDRAAILGVNERLVRMILLISSSLGVALAVSSFGVIGFVGLSVPHISRKLTGASHRKLIFQAFLMGACVLSIADGLAQFMGEVPVGVLTAMTGGPFFCWILSKRDS
ncbi:MAG: iron ABC transporter permease [Synergistaceae bacterium]|nr:iron ABC transporter permease [Synergistaceae bacterium]